MGHHELAKDDGAEEQADDEQGHGDLEQDLLEAAVVHDAVGVEARAVEESLEKLRLGEVARFHLFGRDERFIQVTRGEK